MGNPKSGRAIPFLLLAAAAAGCSTGDPVFPTNGTLQLRLTSGALQAGDAETAPYAILASRVESATIDVVDASSADATPISAFSMARAAPCTVAQTAYVTGDFATQCGGAGLALASGNVWRATIRLTFSRIEARRAWAPVLPASGDYDGDGVVNADDNCYLIPNPDQAPSTVSRSSGSRVGAECVAVSLYTGSLAEDRDGDLITDDLDNCLWRYNPDQSDSNGDGIGDDPETGCEETAPVLLGGAGIPATVPPDAPGTLVLVRELDSVSIREGEVTTLEVDLGAPGAIECDSSFTTCRVDPAAIVVSANPPS